MADDEKWTGWRASIGTTIGLFLLWIFMIMFWAILITSYFSKETETGTETGQFPIGGILFVIIWSFITIYITLVRHNVINWKFQEKSKKSDQYDWGLWAILFMILLFAAIFSAVI